VAAALVHGRLGPESLVGEALRDPAVLALAARVEMIEDAAMNARFPAERRAEVTVETADGARLASGEVGPAWEADDPPSDDELRAKFRWLAAALPGERARAIEAAAWDCAGLAEAAALRELLAAP
jgi:2-methylcitrate dehydratase PrpD